MDEGVGVRQATEHEATEVRAPTDSDLQEVLRKVEVAEEFFEKVHLRALYYRRSFDVSTVVLEEAKCSSRRALDLIQDSKDKNVRPFEILAPTI